jgi:hypothetical protein
VGREYHQKNIYPAKLHEEQAKQIENPITKLLVFSQEKIVTVRVEDIVLTLREKKRSEGGKLWRACVRRSCDRHDVFASLLITMYLPICWLFLGKRSSWLALLT